MSKRILVITEALAEQVRLLLLLTAAGYIPTCCGDLPTALAALNEHSFDVIFSDAIISDTSPVQIAAVEFVGILRPSPLHADIPVIVTGDFISLQNIMDTLRSGVSRFLPKPFTAPELIQAIDAEINLAHYKSPHH